MFENLRRFARGASHLTENEISEEGVELTAHGDQHFVPCVVSTCL